MVGRGSSKGINWLKQNIDDLSKIVLIANDDISFDENYLENAMKIVNKKNINLVSSYENKKKINPFFVLIIRMENSFQKIKKITIQIVLQ